MTFRRGSAPPLIATVFLVLMLMPEEASLFLGQLRLPPARALLLVVFPFACMRFFRKLSAGPAAICWSDLLVIPTGIWFIAADMFTDGPLRALVGAGAIALDFIGAYMVVRGLLNSAGEVVALAKTLCLLIASVGLLGLLDTISGRYISHIMVGQLTGYPSWDLQIPRYGLIRAAGTFEHPILLGAACAFAIVLATSFRGLVRWFTLLAASISLVATISSGPIGGALLGLACVAYRRLTIRQPWRWQYLQISIPLLLSPIFVFHPQPFSFLITHFALDRGTAYYRLLIWQFGGAMALASPIVGIGETTDWTRLNWMSPSVDTVWLAIAMRFGIPAAILLALTLVGACSKSVDTKRAALRPEERALGAALGIVIFQYIFIGLTVDYWGITWMMMGVIAGMRAQLGAVAYHVRRAEVGARQPVAI